MMKILLAALLALVPLSAEASNCSSNPFTFINGQTADATQVMSNFNNLLNCANNNLAHNGANSDITSLTGLSTPLATSEGGSGVAAPTANNVLLGNGASAFQTVAPSTSGNALISNGTTWTSALGPGPVLIQTQTISGGATIAFTSGINSTYDEYLFVISNLLPATNSVDLWMRVSEDGGVTYKQAAGNYRWDQNVVTGGTNNPAGASDTKVALTGVSNALVNTAGHILAGEVRLFNPALSSVFKPIRATLDVLDAALAQYSSSGVYTADGNAINAVVFFPTSGNLSGTISMYGVRK